MGFGMFAALFCGCASADSAKIAGPVKLRVGTYNIKHGELVQLDMNILAKDITDHKLDIVGLQEVDQMTKRVKGIDTMKMLSEATGLKHYRFAKAMDYDGGGYGNGILSRYPIDEHASIPLPATNSGEPRSIGHAVINVNGTRINFFNTHLEVSSAIARTWNIAVLTYLLGKCDEFLLVGDMNTVDIREFNTIKRASFLNTKSEYPTAGKKGIDNIIYSPAWSVLNAGVFDQQHSDHAMLWAELEMKK